MGCLGHHAILLCCISTALHQIIRVVVTHNVRVKLRHKQFDGSTQLVVGRPTLPLAFTWSFKPQGFRQFLAIYCKEWSRWDHMEGGRQARKGVAKIPWVGNEAANASVPMTK